MAGGGQESVAPDGSATGTTIGVGGTDTISNGATLLNPTLSSGGVLNLLGGAVEVGGTVGPRAASSMCRAR